MNKSLNNFFLKMLIISILSINYVMAVESASCSFRKNGKPFLIESIGIKQNEQPASKSYHEILVCKRNNKGSDRGEIVFDLPPNSNAAGVYDTSYQELQPTIARAPANIKIQATTPAYRGVELDGTIDIFTGEFSGGKESVTWKWKDGQDTIEFNIIINITNIQLLSDHFGKKGKYYYAGGDLVTFYIATPTGNMFRRAQVMVTLMIFPIYNDCRRDMFITEVQPTTIDFGSINKNELMEGKKFSKEFTFTTKKNDAKGDCRIDITPKVTLKSNQLIDNKTVAIDNGLTLQIEKQKDQKVEFNKPINYDDAIESHRYFGISSQKFTAIIQKDPQKEVKTGLFDTTLIYIMEYQ